MSWYQRLHQRHEGWEWVYALLVLAGLCYAVATLGLIMQLVTS